jgi:hypothetical protein
MAAAIFLLFQRLLCYITFPTLNAISDGCSGRSLEFSDIAADACGRLLMQSGDRSKIT